MSATHKPKPGDLVSYHTSQLEILGRAKGR